MVVAVVTVVILTTVLATLLVIAHRRLRVEEDPRIDHVEAMLPHANCGACGFPGCRAFAEALVKGDTVPAKCSVSTADGHTRIAAFLGVGVGSAEKRVARLACAGGSNVARQHALYRGWSSCRAAAVVAGGAKRCTWGCLGLGDCVAACKFDALRLNEHNLPVVDEAKCTACGDCVRVCPKDLFAVHPASHRLWVACKNELAGDGLLSDCEVACTACGRCAADAPDLIQMQNNLPVIDYSREHAVRKPIERCPTGAITWIEADGRIIKGPASKKIVRDSELAPTPS